ncbi:MFS transporter [Luteimicrobium subarcticum]|uniref:MFS transporter n=1 Tax=Luteimicrobium subarcticum TaxID=620910 RepID=UPI001FECD8A0|nr:MFS transporter [Luteimicrobium subarcticum]
MIDQPAEPDDRTVRDAWLGLVALAIATLVAITTEMAPIGLLPDISDSLGLDESTTGLLVTVYAGVVAVLAVPLTLGTRRLPRRPLLLGTLLAYAVSNVAVCFAPTFAVLAAARAVGGVSHALFFSLSIAYTARLVGPLHVGRAMTVVTLGGTGGFMIGVPLVTSLGNAAGWRWSFAVLAVACVLTAALVLATLPPVGPAPAPRGDDVLRTRRTRLGVVVGTNALTFLGHYTLYTYIAVVLLGAGLSSGAVGPVLFVLSGMGLIGLWLAGPRLDRSPRTATLAVLGSVAVGMVVVGLGYPTLGVVLAGAAVWCGAFGGPVPTVFQTAAIRAHGATADVAGALVNTTSNAGIAGGAALGSWVLGAHGEGALPWVGVVIVAGAVASVVASRSAFPARA